LRKVYSDKQVIELVFTAAGGAAAIALERAWRKKFPRVRLTRIGRFARALPPGAPNLADYHGYEHLR
ncbi:MAG TPA: thiamine-monophosphate kinase, partial [Opitutaceae bacterium]|nr:thiamine-monophosphate kinase [Opitutaceae bacterium]